MIGNISCFQPIERSRSKHQAIVSSGVVCLVRSARVVFTNLVSLDCRVGLTITVAEVNLSGILPFSVLVYFLTLFKNKSGSYIPIAFLTSEPYSCKTITGSCNDVTFDFSTHNQLEQFSFASSKVKYKVTIL